jgi:hypothetical protein
MGAEYYQLEDVVKLLKRSRSTVIRETNSGKIPSEGVKRNRVYPKEAIDAMVEIEQKVKEKNKGPNVIFSKSTHNDSWQEVQIGRELYGEDDIVPYKRLLEWAEINDDMYMSLKVNGKVVGYSSLMPMDEDVIKALIKDEIREQDIPDEAIKQWTDPNVSVYVASVTVKPSGNATRDSERAGIIIVDTIKWALSYDRQFQIKNWYSIGATKEGQHLLEELGFVEIMSLYDGERKGYYLDNMSAPAKVVSRIMQRDIEKF